MKKAVFIGAEKVPVVTTIIAEAAKRLKIAAELSMATLK